MPRLSKSRVHAMVMSVRIPIRSWQISSSLVIVSPPPFKTFQIATSSGMMRATAGMLALIVRPDQGSNGMHVQSFSHTSTSCQRQKPTSRPVIPLVLLLECLLVQPIKHGAISFQQIFWKVNVQAVEQLSGTADFFSSLFIITTPSEESLGLMHQRWPRRR